MSPEYAMGGAFSVKSDTYSFGVLLLEIVSGLKISSAHLIMNFSGLIAYVSIVEYISNQQPLPQISILILKLLCWLGMEIMGR